MKKILCLAISLFVCSAAMAIQDDDNKKYEWSKDNCRDARVETKTDNYYYNNGYKSQVEVTSSSDKVDTRTTVRDKESGYVVDEITFKGNSVNRSESREYKQEVTSDTECRWTK